MSAESQIDIDELHLAEFVPGSMHLALDKAAIIHAEMIVAIRNFHELFVASVKAAGEAANPHAAEDLLRAMLLFAGAGLDAVFKQLIRDALPLVIETDQGAQQEFRKFAERRLRKSTSDEGAKAGGQNTDYALLAEMLVSASPRDVMIKNLTRALTSDSLQSVDQLLKAAGSFAITRDQFMREHKISKEAFVARNQITHEMDADFASELGRRRREPKQMMEWCRNIVQISHDLLSEVALKLKAPDEVSEQPVGSVEDWGEWPSDDETFAPFVDVSTTPS